MVEAVLVSSCWSLALRRGEPTDALDPRHSVVKATVVEGGGDLLVTGQITLSNDDVAELHVLATRFSRPRVGHAGSVADWSSEDEDLRLDLGIGAQQGAMPRVEGYVSIASRGIIANVELPEATVTADAFRAFATGLQQWALRPSDFAR